MTSTLIMDVIADNATLSEQGELFSAGELSFYFWFYKVTIPTLYGLIAVVGSIGNGMVIFVISSERKMRTTVNLLLLNLAFSDVLFLVVCVPFVAYHFAADNWAFGDVPCKLSQFLLYVTVYVTMYTLVLVAVVRYLTIVFPRSSARWRTRRNVCCAIGVIWAAMLLCNLPTLLIYRVKLYPDSGGFEYPYYYCGVEDKATGRRLFLPFFVLTYVLPLFVITTLYLLVLRFLRHNDATSTARTKARRNPASMVATLDERTQHATRILLVVVVVFAVCWLPLHVHLLVTYFTAQPQSRAYEVSRGLFHCLAYSNSCMNPIIYNYVSRDFRKSFRLIFATRCRWCARKATTTTTQSEREALQTLDAHVTEPVFAVV
ncbi:Galanin receptor type 2 [Lamellibrachia satsuma]|nr:Galanin receptor type 2 [Lamellibrachia satsuma]